jgi:hypothetical protein
MKYTEKEIKHKIKAFHQACLEHCENNLEPYFEKGYFGIVFAVIFKDYVDAFIGVVVFDYDKPGQEDFYDGIEGIYQSARRSVLPGLKDKNGHPINFNEDVELISILEPYFMVRKLVTEKNSAGHITSEKMQWWPGTMIFEHVLISESKRWIDKYLPWQSRSLDDMMFGPL